MALNRDKTLQEAQKLVDKKRYDKAIAEYQKVVADDPNDVRTLLRMGDLYLKMQLFAETIGTYDRVANYYSIQGFSVKAVAVYKQMREIIQKHAVHLEDRFGHILPRLAELLVQLDLKSDALAYYEEMAARFQSVGRDRDALDVFKKIVELDDDNPVFRLRLADGFSRVRDFDGASAELSTAARLLVKMDRKDDAVRVAERILQIRPEGKTARFAAEMHLSRGLATDGMAALTKLQIAFKENPKDLDTLSLLARAFQFLGQPAKAIEVQKEAARVAREVGNRTAFDELLLALLVAAPTDEGVKQLAALSRADASRASSFPPPGESARPEASDPSAPPVESRRIETRRPELEQETERPEDGTATGRPPDGSFEAEPAEEPVDISVSELLADDDAAREDDAPIPLRASYAPAEEESPVRRAQNLAERARSGGDYHGAIAVLRDAVERFPTARELRERLCDLHMECGDQAGAVREMLRWAEHLVRSGDPDAAARLLDEVLLLEANNRAAVDMLRALGYAVTAVDDDFDAGGYGAQPGHGHAEYGQGASAEYANAPYPDGRYANAEYNPAAPLPSYDLDEFTADGLPEIPNSRRRLPSSGPADIALDDPFVDSLVGEALPSYPLEDEVRYAPQPTGRSGPPRGGMLDEAALEEIDFFATHGMLDEAVTLLEEQLARFPQNPLLLEKARELDELRAAEAVNASNANTIAPGSLGAKTAPPPAGGEADDAYDIANALLEMDLGLENLGTSDDLDESGQISVETVFEQFKAGVAAQIAESDAATHYDLGVAYKEMGLISDAIHEFELAARDPARECVSQSMIGMLHTQAGDLDAATDAFLRGLHAAEKTPEQELALTYEIGSAYEARKNLEQALYYFQGVARINPSHKDVRGSVAERIASLEKAMSGGLPAKSAPKPPILGTGDEFDAAFDDLFNPK